MREIEKKGLSPVVATVLLIVLALVLVVIIFAWARTWIGEKIEKDLGAGPEVIESFCKDVEFIAEANKGTGTIDVNNIGNIPLYGVEISKRESSSVKSMGGVRFSDGAGLPRGSGDSVEFDLSGVVSGDELIVTPVLLGETDEYKKTFVCAEEYGVSAEVI